MIVNLVINIRKGLTKQVSVMVSDMAKEQPDYYNKQSKRYVSELCIIIVFYSIPVGQLVYSHQIVIKLLLCSIFIHILHK